jgi:serine/threonine protein kinase
MNLTGNGRQEGQLSPPSAVVASGPDPDDPRVIAALEEYQAAVQAGQAPEREAFQARYPEIAAVLAECLDGLDWMRGAPPGPRSAATFVVGPAGAGVEPGTPLGDYKILREVGRGGMGVVYEAVQESLGRHVALKVLPSHALLAAEHLERFRREARAAALLHHSNIVPVFGVGCECGVHFYAMQFIQGQSLDHVLGALRQARGQAAARPPSSAPSLSVTLIRGLQTGQFPGGVAGAGDAVTPAPCSPAEPTGPAEASGDTPRSGLAGSREGEYFRSVARIGVQVAEALAYAHRQGILHRDIKPSNLLLDAQGTVWVTDFGLAKAEGNGDLTGAGDVVGTLRYLPPERFEGCSDRRGDVYSLGATLYELLTLRPAFDEPERARLIERVTRGAPPLPRHIDGRIPGDLETIVLKALAREPAERYQSAEALAEDLRRFLLDRPIRARRAGPAERAWRWCRRNRIVAGLLAAAVALSAGLGVLALLLWDRQQQTAAALQQADDQRREADGRRQLAEANFQRACALLHNAPLKYQLTWLEGQGVGRRSRTQTQEKALGFSQGLLTEPGPDPGDRLLTAQVHIELGDTYVFLWRRPEGAQEYQKAITLLRQLVGEFPGEAGFRASLAHCFKELGWCKQDPAHAEEGEDEFEQAIALYQGLREEFRDVPWYRLQLADCWSDLGEWRRRTGRFAQGEEALRQAVALHEQLYADFPEGKEVPGVLAGSHKDLAWVLAVRPDRQPQHAAEAVAHAQRAVAIAPGNHDCWHTLGVAHCRMGHWKEALAAIEKSRQLSNEAGPPTSFDRFFESMAYSGLGDKENARCCYDEGVRWMEQHLPDHHDLRRFRAEAAGMLGIEQLE